MCAYIIPFSAQSDKNTDGIITPKTSSPSEIDPGGMLQAIVRLRLPLTPPPGVQQPAAREGWRATLKRRDAFAADGGSTTIEFPATVVRIRPASSFSYRISIEIVPWMLPGRYDLLVSGPGFVAEQPQSVVVGEGVTETQRSDLEIRQIADNVVTATNSSSAPHHWTFDIVLPATLAGLDVRAGDELLRPNAVAWAEWPTHSGATRRALHFEIIVPGATSKSPGRKTVTWSPVETQPCGAEIKWSGGRGSIDPMEWTDLRFHAPGFETVSVIWRFGDGESDAGRKVRHRFLLSDTATVSAAAFDVFGRECRSKAQANLDVPLKRSTCACHTAGAIHHSLLGWLIGLLPSR